MREGESDNMNVHGGDIYRNHVTIDFSVNVNPLGIPQSVKDALHRAVEQSSCYPDIESASLKKAVSKMLVVPEEYLLFGNGASELLIALIHGLQPAKTVIPIPSFYGYEHAAKAAGTEILYYEMKQKNNFCITEDIYHVLTEDIDLLFLANPNNPTGVLLEKSTITELLLHCKKKGIYVVLDECFIEFNAPTYSMLSEMESFDHFILLRAFTKIFSIPGVRLGYLLCKNQKLLARIADQLPEWNLSCFAQKAGCACAREGQFITKTEEAIRKERSFLEEGLSQRGLQVFPSMANFILIYRKEAESADTLYAQLLRQGILIRDCQNFRGLDRGFYRIAIKTRDENQKLLQAIENI